MTVDPRITAILEARKNAGITITKTITPASIPALPQRPTTGGSIGGGMSAQSVGTPEKVEVKLPASTPEPVEVPVPDSELAVILTDVIAAGDTLVRKLISAFGDRKLSMSEALALAPDIRNLVSLAVSQAAPAIKGSSARDLVILVLPGFITKYVSPFLPVWMRGWVTAATISALIKGLQFAYDQWVKPRLSKK